jgi:hypothetical protein
MRSIRVALVLAVTLLTAVAKETGEQSCLES